MDRATARASDNDAKVILFHNVHLTTADRLNRLLQNLVDGIYRLASMAEAGTDVDSR